MVPNLRSHSTTRGEPTIIGQSRQILALCVTTDPLCWSSASLWASLAESRNLVVPPFDVPPFNASMITHRFHVGQTVSLRLSAVARNAAAGTYEIRAILPEECGQSRYRIKSLIEPHERVVSEQELSEAWSSMQRMLALWFARLGGSLSPAEGSGESAHWGGADSKVALR